jgi:hypothetical protein
VYLRQQEVRELEVNLSSDIISGLFVTVKNLVGISFQEISDLNYGFIYLFFINNILRKDGNPVENIIVQRQKKLLVFEIPIQCIGIVYLV